METDITETQPQGSILTSQRYQQSHLSFNIPLTDLEKHMRGVEGVGAPN